MKKTLLIFAGIMAAATLASTLQSCKESRDTDDYSQFVDPMIGTGGHGHTFPELSCPMA